MQQAHGKVDEARAGLVATCGWSEEEASSFMSQYSAAFASFLAALTGEADMSTGGASLGGGGAASSHPAMALAVAEDALSGLESRLVRAGVDSMDGEEGRPHAGRVMRLLHLGECVTVGEIWFQRLLIYLLHQRTQQFAHVRLLTHA